MKLNLQVVLTNRRGESCNPTQDVIDALQRIDGVLKTAVGFPINKIDQFRWRILEAGAGRSVRVQLVTDVNYEADAVEVTLYITDDYFNKPLEPAERASSDQLVALDALLEVFPHDELRFDWVIGGPGTTSLVPQVTLTLGGQPLGVPPADVENALRLARWERAAPGQVQVRRGDLVVTTNLPAYSIVRGEPASLTPPCCRGLRVGERIDGSLHCLHCYARIRDEEEGEQG